MPKFSCQLTDTCETSWLCSHSRGQGAASLALDWGPIVSPWAQALCPGGSKVLLLSSFLLSSHSCQCGLQVHFSFREPAGSCLTSAELIQSSASFLPYPGLWGKPAGRAWQGDLRGACDMATAASSWHRPSARFPYGACLPVSAASWLRLHRWREGAQLRPPCHSPEGDRVSGSPVSACSCLSGHLWYFLPWGQQRASLLSPS